jgi:arginine decarboxylase
MRIVMPVHDCKRLQGKNGLCASKSDIIVSAMTWSRDDARQQYNISGWSAGYFDVGAVGHLVALPGGDADGPAVDLYSLAHAVCAAGLSWPVLVRFTGILRRQVGRLVAAFDVAISDAHYRGTYTAIYPVKVNQQRHVVDAIVLHGGDRVGLEAGSKPELMALIGVAPAGGTIICNGYKDAEYIRLALIAQRLGHDVVIVIEKQSELSLILKISATMNITPRLGVRVRLSSATGGNWQNTGGDRSKFGFTAAGLLALMARLQDTGMRDCLQMLHCHPGSQISSIATLQAALQEVACTWAALTEAGFPVATVNVGGGLGVDYQGMASTQGCSVNYDMQEYAAAVVNCFAAICRQRKLAAPQLMSESGRALTAHHAVLITDVIDTEQVLTSICRTAEEAPKPVASLQGYLDRAVIDHPLTVYAQANEVLEQLRAQYTCGGITLAQRAHGESLYYALCRRLQRLLAESQEPPPELDTINRQLADKYFCNLSVFQSMPDVWGIDQLFPVVPLHRLDEAPQRRAILHDLTCDSDGHIEYYVDSAGVESSLPVHAVKEGEPYLLGFFLLGAYQEILGDMHNLFGDTDAVNVELTETGAVRLIEPRHGDTVDTLLRYVEFNPTRLLASYRDKIAAAGLSEEEGASCLQMLKDVLGGTTYLDHNE